MKTLFRLLMISILSFSIGWIGFATFNDILTYYEIMSSDYQTPWYSNDYLKQPFTLLMLRGEPSKDYWTTNVVGDKWYVREIDHKGKKFWTILWKEK